MVESDVWEIHKVADGFGWEGHKVGHKPAFGVGPSLAGTCKSRMKGRHANQFRDLPQRARSAMGARRRGRTQVGGWDDSRLVAERPGATP